MLALVAAGFTACDGKDEPGYSAATKPAEEQRVFFASASESVLVSEEAASFSVNVYRPEDDVDSELLVQLIPSFSSDADAQIFTVPADVKFEAGKAIASFEVGYKLDAMQPNMDYPFSIAIGEANANQYAVASLRLNVSHPVWSDWALFEYDPEAGRTSVGTYILGVAYSGTWLGARIYSRTNPIDTNEMQFRLELPEDEDNFTGYFTYLEFETHDGGKTLEVPQQPCAIDDELLIIGAKQLNSERYEASTFDPVSGVFTFNLIYLLNDGSGRGYGPGSEYLELPGYIDTNSYEVKISDQGQVKINDTDYAVINFNLSSAVAYADYTVVKGILDEEQVAEVAQTIQDPQQQIYEISTIEKSGNVTLSFAAPDDYTIVAVGYKVGNDGVPEAKTTASLSFHFDTFNPYAGWTTVSDNALYTDNVVASLFGEPSFANYEMEVTIQKSDEFEGLYRIVNPFAEFEQYGLEMARFGSIEFDVQDPDHVYFPLADSGIVDGGSNIQLMSYSYYMLLNEVPAEEIPAQYWGTFKDNKVTMAALNAEQAADFLAKIGNSIYYCDADFSVDFGVSSASKPGKTAKKLGKILTRDMKVPAARIRPAKAYYHVKDAEESAAVKPERVKASDSSVGWMLR